MMTVTNYKRNTKMNAAKPLDFNAKALDYLILSFLSALLAYIPFFGWAFLLNYTSGWFADRTLVNGKKVTYSAGYGESLKFVTIGTLLVVITFGIYAFWFAPKMYHYVTDHMSYSDDVAPVPSTPVAAQAAAEPTDTAAVSKPPVDPTAPTGPVAS
jgi:hypothetical protein